ncbi:hypothetical protein HPB50_007985 [Hyalomma asiaticum]|uniref:Uncharacterized protein n=1 Tax=Hyalomma asiaticum TaxID=266040 RepID=A0ACB7RUU1_HYAAI|nr:hypothetical protein HPB50_007985 [Hyalomma asiaticum]
MLKGGGGRKKSVMTLEKSARKAASSMITATKSPTAPHGASEQSPSGANADQQRSTHHAWEDPDTPKPLSDPAPVGSRRPHRLVFYIACAVAMVSVTLILSVATGLLFARKPIETCVSDGCHAYSEAFLASMDTSADPCQDFGRYVCGRYSHPRNLSVAEVAKEKHMQELLAPTQNESLVISGQNALQKTWRYYKSCENVILGKADNVATVVDYMRQAGIRWPVPSYGDVDPFAAMMFLCKQLGWPSTLEFELREQSDHYALIVVEPSAVTQQVLKQRRHLLQNESEYEAYFTALANHFQLSFAEKGNSATFEATMRAETELFEYIDHDAGAMSVLGKHSYGRIRKGLEQLINASLQQLVSVASRADNFSMDIVTTHREFVEALLIRAVETPRDVELVLGWHIAQYVAVFANRELATAYYLHVRGYSGEAAVKEHKALSEVEAIDNDTVKNMLRLRRAKQLPGAGADINWLLGDELHSGPLEPFLQLEDKPRDVAVMASAIVFPYYVVDVPDYVRYGTFASAFAEQVVLLFRTFGSRPGSDPHAIEAFRKCISDTFPLYAGDDTILLNASAIEAASLLYKRAVMDRAELQMPGLENLDPWKLFYVSACYRFCGGPGVRQCDRAFRLDERFGNAFGCAATVSRTRATCRMFDAAK